MNPYGFDALRVALPRARLTLGSPLQGREAGKSVRICSVRAALPRGAGADFSHEKKNKSAPNHVIFGYVGGPAAGMPAMLSVGSRDKNAASMVGYVCTCMIYKFSWSVVVGRVVWLLRRTEGSRSRNFRICGRAGRGHAILFVGATRPNCGGEGPDSGGRVNPYGLQALGVVAPEPASL